MKEHFKAIKVCSELRFLEFYLKTFYSGKNIVIIDTRDCPNMCEAYKWITENITNLYLMEYDDNDDYIFVEFQDIEKALKFCNSAPKYNPYVMVWERDQIVHTNG